MSDTATIGSDESCDLPVAFEGVSSHHCRIVFENGEVWVEDLNSTNGTYVDGEQVEPGRRQRLGPSSKLNLAGEATLTWGDIQDLRSDRYVHSDDRTPNESSLSPSKRDSGYEPRGGYAGFWRRFGALLIDSALFGLILSPFIIALGAIIGSSGPAAPVDQGQAALRLLGGYYTVVIPLNWIYFAGFEASGYQGTPGKRLVGLKVTDLQGEPITFLRATGRHFGKILSFITFYVGFLMAGWTVKHQALHDKLANCLVINDS